MKDCLKIIFKIVGTIVISIVICNLIALLFDLDALVWLFYIIAVVIYAIGLMISAGIKSCITCCKKRENTAEEKEGVEEKSNVVEMPNQQEEIEGITLLELIYYIVAVVFAIWIANALQDIGEVYSKIEIIKLHFIWLGIFDAFLIIAARTPKIKSKGLIIVYTVLNIIFVGLVIGNTPFNNMPKASSEAARIYLNNLPKMFVADAVAFLAAYPAMSIFKKTKKENEK